MKRLITFLFCIVLVSGCSYINQPNGPEVVRNRTDTSQLRPTNSPPPQTPPEQLAGQYRFGAPSNTTHALCPREETATDITDIAALNPDSDHDGILDKRDECPATPGNTAVDSMGCPISLFLSLTIPFQSNQTNFSETQYSKIQQLARLLKNNPQSTISLAGHTDSSGNKQDNMRISNQRAQSIKQTLVRLFGIDEQRITAQGYGDSKPLVSNQTLSGRERNRRVDVVLNGYYSTHTSYIALHRPYKLHFEANQTDMDASIRQHVEALGKYLQQNPDVVADINGYTDNSGNEKINLALSVMRAETVKRYLMESYGLSPDRLQARGYGQSNPIADNATEKGRCLNRRVTITLNKSGDPANPRHRFNASLEIHRTIDSNTAPLAKRFDIPFKPQNAMLQESSKQAVDEIGSLMRSRPDMRIVIEGHASGLPEIENRRISQARALSVKNYLQERYHIDSERLRAIGFGNDLTNTANASEGTNRVHIRLDRF